MLCCSVPEGIRKQADRFKDLGQGRLVSYNNWCAVFAYSLYQHTSLSDFVRANPWSHSVSDLSRAIKDFPGTRLMRRLRSSILKRYRGNLNPADFCFAIDDTSNPRYGKTIFRRGLWHCSKGPYVGQKIIVLALIDIKRDVAIPLSYAFGTNKGSANYESGTEASLNLLAEALSEGFPKFIVVADSWFSGKDFIAGAKSLGIESVVEAKFNRRIKTHPGRNCRWQKIGEGFSGLEKVRTLTRCDNRIIKSGKKRAKCVAERVMQLKGIKSPFKVAAVYNRVNSVEAFAFYASSDRTISGARIWELSRARWRIEIMFRILKQDLSFGRLPCGGKEASDVAVAIPFCLLVSLHLDDAEIYWKAKPRKTVGQLIKSIREVNFTKAIDMLLSTRNEKLRNKLRSRRHANRSAIKPVDSYAEAS